MLQKLNFLLSSTSPIILHNGQTADPRNKFAKAMKAISGKRSKTDADHEEMARLEFLASLYVNQEGRIILPDYCLESALVNGAKKLKLGQQCKAGLFVEGHALLEFDGCNLTPDQLWERDQNTFSIAVRVQTSKVIRTRFMAEKWAAKVAIAYEDSLLNQQEVIDIVGIVGSTTGMFEWRPKHGRFTPEVVNAGE